MVTPAESPAMQPPSFDDEILMPGTENELQSETKLDISEV